MARMLKCPKCGKQSAYKCGGWAKDGRYYGLKCCKNCGHEGPRKYLSLEASNRLRGCVEDETI